MRISIDSQLEQVRIVGRQIQAYCLENGLASEDAAMVELAVVEAVNNAVIHAYGSRPGGSIIVDMEHDQDSLIFSISDWGGSFDPASISPSHLEALSPDPASESGRGLAIMQAIMDRLDYFSRDGCNTMVLTKRKNRT